MSNKTLVILGAGGHAKVCYEIAVSMKLWEKIIILDDNPSNEYFEISGPLEDIKKYPTASFFVAVGDNQIRKHLFNNILGKNYQIVSLIHDSARISPTASISEGTVVMPGVVLNADATIGKGCVLNTGCIVEHDNKIGDFVHISPGAKLAGNVRVGTLTWIGIGTVIINNIKVIDSCIVGAGSVITSDLNMKGLYYGVPVEFISKE